MGWWGEMFGKKPEKPSLRFERALANPEVNDVILEVEGDLIASSHSGSDDEKAWIELFWPKSHIGTDRPKSAKQIFVVSSKKGITLEISYKGELWDLQKRYELDGTLKPFGELSFKDKIKWAAQFADMRLQDSSSNSIPAQV